MTTSHKPIVAEPVARPIKGVSLATACAAIKQTQRDDVALLELGEGSSCAAVFTQNRFCAAPVAVAKRHLSQSTPRYLLINSGNANAGMGEQGMVDALDSCQAVANQFACEKESVLPFSTGVIGERLAVGKISSKLDQLANGLSENNWPNAARAIMTTDTVEKIASVELACGDKTLSVTGMAKGSGMIHPNMATMLAYIATDASVDEDLLSACLNEAVAMSFNAITVDGDTSTNDACVLMASGCGEVSVESQDSSEYQALSEAISAVCQSLAQAIVADGEGATCLVHVEVSGGQSQEECRQVADTVALSPLVKTALFAQDPNWGRILAAVGRAGIDDLDAEQVSIYLDDVLIAERGARAASYEEAAAKRVMEQKEYCLRIGLGRGSHESRVSTCDLSYDYVRINAEYRS